MDPQPYTIRIADDVLEDLRARLARVRWPDEIPDTGWQYGTDLTYLQQLVDYWRDHYDESVPGGGDAYVLSRIVHDWDDEPAIHILKSCRRAMIEGKKVLLIEQVIPPGNGPHPAKFIDLNMLVLFAGRERTAVAFQSLFEAAGFAMTRIIPTSTHWSVIEGVAA